MAGSNNGTIRKRLDELAEWASTIRIEGGLEQSVAPTSRFDPTHFIEEITEGQVFLAEEAYTEAQRYVRSR